MRLCVLFLLMLLLAGCGDRQVMADPHESGRRIYNFRCYFCHGYSGDAQTVASAYLDPKPRNFAATTAASLRREDMIRAVAQGRAGSAMQGFAGILTAAEIEAVVDFVRREFMVDRAQNTRYHTRENGWPDHERHRLAFPFATGELSLATPYEQLTPEQQAGKRLFASACISCHDSSSGGGEVVWDPRPVSYPRNGYMPAGVAAVDAVTSASPYVLHDRVPRLSKLTGQEGRGEAIYQRNCAFCHAADGTGRNWIGSFLEPHPRDLTDPNFMEGKSAAQLAKAIAEGLPGTSMPAWRGVLSESDIRAVVAYVSRAFQVAKAGSDKYPEN